MTTIEELNHELTLAEAITCPVKRAKRINKITNEFYDFAEMGCYGDGGIDADYIDETSVDTMVTQGNNTAWNEAIKLAEINATPEGVARAEKVKADRNREYTKNRTRANRAKNKDANEARKAARKQFYFEKKTREKIKAVPPSKRA